MSQPHPANTNHPTTSCLWKSESDARGRARLRRRLGGILDLLARGSLLHEEGTPALVPRAAHKGGDRRPCHPLDPFGSLPKSRPQFGSVARWPRARPLRDRAGVRHLGSRTHRAQLGHPDVTKGRPGAGDQRSLPPGPPPHLLWRPGCWCRHRCGAELGVVDRRGLAGASTSSTARPSRSTT